LTLVFKKILIITLEHNLSEKGQIYLLLGLREVSLDNNPNTAIVIKKKAVAYTNSFSANIMLKFKVLIF
jgi:hypothetical protein